MSQLYKKYCYRCIHFQTETKVCTKFYFNVVDYPGKFVKKCNGEYYVEDQAKEHQIEQNSDDEEEFSPGDTETDEGKIHFILEKLKSHEEKLPPPLFFYMIGAMLFFLSIIGFKFLILLSLLAFMAPIALFLIKLSFTGGLLNSILLRPLKQNIIKSATLKMGETWKQFLERQKGPKLEKGINSLRIWFLFGLGVVFLRDLFLFSSIILAILTLMEIVTRALGRSQRYQLAFISIAIIFTLNLYTRVFMDSNWYVETVAIWLTWITALFISILAISIIHISVFDRSSGKIKQKRLRKIFRFLVKAGIPMYFLAIYFFLFVSLAAMLNPDLESNVPVWLAILLIIYISLRYHLGKYIEENKIIFFRSFQSVDTANFYAQVLVPTLRPYGRLIGLASLSQSQIELNYTLHPLKTGEFALVDDVHWRDWIVEAINDCWLAIFDVSIISESLEWELSLAYDTIGPERIILVSQHNKATVDVDRQIKNPIPNEYSQGYFISYSPKAFGEVRDKLEQIVISIFDKQETGRRKKFLPFYKIFQA